MYGQTYDLAADVDNGQSPMFEGRSIVTVCCCYDFLYHDIVMTRGWDDEKLKVQPGVIGGAAADGTISRRRSTTTTATDVFSVAESQSTTPPTPFHAAHFDNDDATEIDYLSSSDFYAKTLISDLERYRNIYAENTDSKSKSPAEALAAIIKALDLTGIRYPIGRNTCDFCKGVCNKIMSSDKIERCKYDACVKFLGGYKGTEAAPSCNLISRP
ncbi:hypothetical protein EC957_011121 [Mortierella hygrophila]|uniref:Uncharacterized protein n=1 Tax=Mortierella hygrophila TaxID=979708 RepID=A0A9P6F859_9FUNG|nr:hypothetical protein EC957_011121 [Mortierella hygrophila]